MRIFSDNCLLYDLDLKGNVFKHGPKSTALNCQNWCLYDKRCLAFVFYDKYCWLKSSLSGERVNEGRISGPPSCVEESCRKFF